ncbi:hypothetical protein ACFLQR_01165 [Verrucomicrobiota bacterium]
MKTPLFLCLVVAAVAGVAFSEKDQRAEEATVEKRLTGKWLGVSGHWGKENPAAASRNFTFMTNRQFKASIGNETITGNYRITVTNKPFQIDFTFEFKGKKATTLTIFDFPKENHLRIAEWDPNWRRKRFRPGITFKKKASSNK